jgi:hypothetical protein
VYSDKLEDDERLILQTVATMYETRNVSSIPAMLVVPEGDPYTLKSMRVIAQQFLVKVANTVSSSLTSDNVSSYDSALALYNMSRMGSE